MKMINYIKKYFKRIIKPEFLIICLLSILVFPIIRPYIVSVCNLLLFKCIGHVAYIDNVKHIFSIIVCLIVFGLAIAICTDIYLQLKKYYKQEKNIEQEELDKRSKEIYSFYIQDLES